MRKKVTTVTLLVFGMTLVAVTTQAQERTSHVDGWEFVAAPYIWFAGMDGDETVRGTKASVDADFGDVWDNLDVGAQGYFELRKDKWGGYVDATYIRVTSDAEVGPVDIDIEASTTMIGAGVLYQIYEGYAGSNPVATDIFVGGRYTKLDTELDFSGLADISADKNWVDPIIGVTYNRDMSEKFLIKTTADIGGFGIGSDFTWSVTILGGYRLGSHSNLWFGYRYLDIDYDTGSGARKFEHDMAMHGPILSASFHF